MRKWQNLAPPDDPGSWFDVDGVWPTPSGSYETIQFLDTGTAATAAATGDVIYAWCANTLASRREYVLTSALIWEYAAGAYTDRTGGVTIGTSPFAAQYGDVTVIAMGAANPSVKSTGGNFSALAGAPNAEIVLPVANALLYLNTNTSADGWATSDVGDYTNYTTGEAASGRLIQTPGAITAGVSFGNYAIVFKGDAIYRITYVGGVVKWTTELLYRGIGCIANDGRLASKYAACSGAGAILFIGYYDSSILSSYAYLFDGSSPPRRVNPVTQVPEGRITFNPQSGVFTIKTEDVSGSVLGTTYYNSTQLYYSLSSDSWGKYANVAPSVNGSLFPRVPLLGDFAAFSEKSSTQVLYGKSAASTLRRFAPGVSSSTYHGTCYLYSTAYGAADQKTTFRRLTPKLRRRESVGGGSPVASCYAEFFPDCFLTRVGATMNVSTSQTLTAAESSPRKRFDFLASDCFAHFRVSFTDIFVDIDDFIITAVPAGKE